MRRFSLSVIVALGCALFFMLPTQSLGQDFVYQPKNPAFGGSPLNYQWMMNSANTQNKFKDTPDYGFNDDPMANFQQDLQRQVLSELTQSIVRQKLGENFDFSTENTLEFGDFSVDIIPSGDGVSFRIFDVVSGEETSVTIPNI